MNVDRIATRIASTQECDSAIADRLIQMCKNTGREVQSVTVKPIHGIWNNGPVESGFGI